MRRYTFDMKFFAAVTVPGTSEHDARRELARALANAELILTDRADGTTPRVAIDIDGTADLTEVSGA